MIRREGDTLLVTGPLTMETVPKFTGVVDQHFRAGVTQIDFSAVTEIDSSAVALALEWQRIAAGNKVQLQLCNLPPAMLNLARLYGVSELVQPN